MKITRQQAITESLPKTYIMSMNGIIVVVGRRKSRLARNKQITTHTKKLKQRHQHGGGNTTKLKKT